MTHEMTSQTMSNSMDLFWFLPQTIQEQIDTNDLAGMLANFNGIFGRYEVVVPSSQLEIIDCYDVHVQIRMVEKKLRRNLCCNHLLWYSNRVIRIWYLSWDQNERSTI